MNKKISLGLALSLIAVSIAVTFILTSFFSLQSFNKKVVDVNEKSKKYSSLQVLDSYIRDNYLGDIDEKELSDGIMKGYVSGIGDKYSRYLTETEYLTEKNEDSGELVGLGLTLAEDASGYMRISEVLEDSPASDSGLEVGDLITRIDELDIKEAGFNEGMDARRGTEGSSIKLTVHRDGKATDYELVRRTIKVKTVETEMLGSNIGYIKVTGFKQNTPDQFISALERLTANGATALIFDLRDKMVEATTREVSEFGNNSYISIDVDWLTKRANTKTRRLIKMITESGTLKTFMEMDARKRGKIAKSVNIDIDIKNNKINMPRTLGEVNRVLEFLNEDVFKGLISSNVFRTNSKRLG